MLRLSVLLLLLSTTAANAQASIRAEVSATVVQAVSISLVDNQVVVSDPSNLTPPDPVWYCDVNGCGWLVEY